MIPDGKNRKAVNSTMSVHGLFLLDLLVILCLGCGAKGFDSIRPGIEERGHYISGVPFFRQTEQDCGPAALAGILAFHGRPANLETITASIYLPKLRGTLPMDLERYAKASGFITTSPDGTFDALRSAVRSDIPVICLLDLGFGPYRQPHYVTVIGFDDGNKIIIMHDGATANRTMTYETFGKYWSRAGNWMIVITPQPGP
jgi:ABC-type bacteriocin/lantibiotic exporter with double-glycine peptidase domain